jgi:hypothetical protein
MNIPSNFLTVAYLGSFAGAVAVCYLVTSYLKGLVKMALPDYAVRILALLVALAITVFLAVTTGKTDGASIGLAILNAFLVAFAAMGLHESMTDPGAVKTAKAPVGPLPSPAARTIYDASVPVRDVQIRPTGSTGAGGEPGPLVSP